MVRQGIEYQTKQYHKELLHVTKYGLRYYIEVEREAPKLMVKTVSYIPELPALGSVEESLPPLFQA